MSHDRFENQRRFDNQNQSTTQFQGSASNPVRYPELRSAPTMTKRAWWLVALNLLIPGSVQLLAGNRRLGRFGAGATFLLWTLAIITLLVYWLAPSVVYTIATNAIGLTIAQLLLGAYALLWIVLTLDTLRLVQLIRTVPSARILVAGLAVIALVATAGTAGYGAFVAGVARSGIASVFSGGDMAAPVDGRYNILLLGGDAGPDRTGLRPDSISVASVDATTGATTIIGIPRNMEQIQFAKGSPLYTPFPKGYVCGDLCLIDYIYTYGEEHPELYPDAAKHGTLPGVEAMKDAAEGVTGLAIQYFVLIDMQGFSDLVDALGGVTIDVPERTPIGGVTGKTPMAWVEAGSQKMSGFTALWYARSRYNSNDYARMARQRQVQEALLKQFQPANVLAKFQDVVKAGTQVVKTDVPSGMLGGFVDLGAKSRTLPVTHLELVPPTFNPAHPDYQHLHAAVSGATTPAKPKP